MPVDPLTGRDAGLDERMVRAASHRVLALVEGHDLDVAETLRIEVLLDQTQNPLRILIGYKSEVQLRRRRRWQHGLGPRPTVARVEAVHVAGRPEDETLLQPLAGEIIEEGFNAVELSHLVLGVVPISQGLPLGCGHRLHIVVETRDAHLAIRALEGVQRPQEPPGRVCDRGGHRRVQIPGGLAGAQLEVEQPLTSQGHLIPLLGVPAARLPHATVRAP